jgi:uncharacterized membrane protein
MSDDPFVIRLADELARWRGEGLLDAATAHRIRRRYGLAPADDEGDAGQNRTAAIIASLGSILVGLGVILFVASNWQNIDRPFKLALLLTGLLGFSAVAFYLRTHGHPRVGAALVFCSALVFGANIFLVGQIYHVRSSDPTFLLIWAAGLLPMAYVATSRLTLFVALAALLGWYGMLLNDWGAWRGPHALVAPAFLAIGLSYLAVAGILGRFDRTAPLAAITRIVGVTTTFAVLFVLSFEETWRSAGRAAASGGDPPFAFMASVVIVLVAAVLAVVTRQLLGQREGLAWQEPAGSLALLGITVALVMTTPFSSAAPYAVTFNLIALAVVLWAVLLGVATGRESLVNLALGLFGVVVMARYFDYFGTLLDRSLGFIGAGLLLLVGGFLLERTRRFLISQSQPMELSNAN